MGLENLKSVFNDLSKRIGFYFDENGFNANKEKDLDNANQQYEDESKKLDKY
mgnify:CR=1 FL=1